MTTAALVPTAQAIPVSLRLSACPGGRPDLNETEAAGEIGKAPLFLKERGNGCLSGTRHEAHPPGVGCAWTSMSCNRACNASETASTRAALIWVTLPSAGSDDCEMQPLTDAARRPGSTQHLKLLKADDRSIMARLGLTRGAAYRELD